MLILLAEIVYRWRKVTKCGIISKMIKIGDKMIKTGDKMIKIAICDDQYMFLLDLEKMINCYAETNEVQLLVHKYTKPLELISSISQEYDVYILDIQMPAMNGMELAKAIRKKDENAYLMFLTSFENYVYEGYSVKAAAYLRKPISQKRINVELSRAIENIKRNDNRYLTVRNKEGYFKIYLNNIVYIETYKRNLLIHTESENIVCLKKMKDLEAALPGELFYRCHSSYIVNLDYIKSIQEPIITLINNEQIFVSKKQKKELLQNFASYVGDRE